MGQIRLGGCQNNRRTSRISNRVENHKGKLRLRTAFNHNSPQIKAWQRAEILFSFSVNPFRKSAFSSSLLVSPCICVQVCVLPCRSCHYSLTTDVNGSKQWDARAAGSDRPWRGQGLLKLIGLPWLNKQWRNKPKCPPIA